MQVYDWLEVKAQNWDHASCRWAIYYSLDFAIDMLQKGIIYFHYLGIDGKIGSAFVLLYIKPQQRPLILA